MESRIIGFHQDEEGQWVAELSCGHSQHVRHDPPWQVRPWVVAPEARTARLGTVLECGLCDAGSADQRSLFEDARMRGLCADGAAEVARKPGHPRRSDEGT